MRSVLMAGLMILSATPGWAQPAPPGAPAPATLHLVCTGIVRYAGLGGATTEAEGQVLVDVTGPAAGRIKLPDLLLSQGHDKTDTDWRAFESLTIAETQIDGKVTLGFLNKPTVTLDRVTGHLDVMSAGSPLSGESPLFGGECRPYDPNARKF